MLKRMTRVARLIGTGLVGFCLLSGLAAKAEPLDYYMPTDVSYDPKVPTPEQAFGFGPGDRPIRHDVFVQYLTAVAASSDRITAEIAGYSHEGRPILFFTVTSPDNQARLPDIRQTHFAHLSSEIEELPADQPVITWVNFGVHGAESAGMDAAVPTLYYLAAAQGPQVDRLLDGSVILVTAIFNPDGHSRRVDHVERFSSKVPVTDPAHEQHQLWVDARTNHYWFDLNRQWLLQTQPESRAWMTQWHRWKPNVSVDMHEMGSDSTYYFHPGTPARKNPLIPGQARELLVQISDYFADWMDEEAKLYFSEEGFDNFYIGKGSTYPAVNGGVGILFEAGAARGGIIESDTGIKTYGDNIRTHFRNALATITAAVDLRGELLTYQREFFQSALDLANADATKGYVFTARDDQARARIFIDLMRRHDVRVYDLANDISIDGVAYNAGDAWVIPMAQPQYKMIRGIFDRVTEFEEEIFYDVSGWTLPLAYDLDYAELSSRRFRDVSLGNPASADMPVFAAPPVASYGYAFDWSGFYAPRALYRLLSEGAMARLALQPFTTLTSEGTINFKRGTIFVPLDRQTISRERLHEIVSTIARDDGILVHAVASGHSTNAGVDLGGRNSFDTLELPQPLLLIGDGIQSYDAGEVWHQVDFRMEMPLTLRDKDDMSGIDWSRYTHIIMPGGSNPGLSERHAKRLAQWVREGGTIVAARQAAQWVQDLFKPDGDGEKNPAAKGGDDQAAREVKRFDYASIAQRNAEHVIGGALFGSDMDITHPLGFGFMDRSIASLRNTTLVLETPQNPYATVARYAEQPLLSGYASERRQQEIAGTPMMVAERVGQGAVVLFADNPNFRATMLGTSKLFMNSLFFSKAFSAPRGDYDEAGTTEE